MGTHRIGWRLTAVGTLAAALTGQGTLGAAVEDCAAVEGAEAQAACIDRLVNATTTAEHVQSSIVLIDRRPGGELLFRLANGQAWVQQAARFVAVEAGERVVIAPARLGGGHILATERSAAARVRRLEEPSAREREGPAPRMREPSAGEREGSAPRR